MRIGWLAVACLVLASCARDVAGPTDSTPASYQAVLPDAAGGVAASERTAREQWTEVLPDQVDPCTGALHTVTIDWSCTVPSHENDTSVRTCQRSARTTPTGYVGHGTSMWVYNDHESTYLFHDILRNEAGNKIQVNFRWMIDVGTGKWKVAEFTVTCLGQGR